MASTFFPISTVDHPPTWGCTSGPHIIKDGTGRDSEVVVRHPGVDKDIVDAEQRCLNQAAKNAVDQAATAIKDISSRCVEPCVARIAVTLSDYRYQEETGHSSAGEGATTSIEYLISAEVDWTVEAYCEKGPEAAAIPDAEGSGEGEGFIHTSPDGKKLWVKRDTTTTPNGCTSKKASGGGDGYGISRPPLAARAKAEEEAKKEALDDAAAQINEQLEWLRCAKKCKKQKTEIQLTDVYIISSQTDVYGGLARGFEAHASVRWAATAICGEP